MDEIPSSVEMVIRVKMPSSSGFSCGPSGDTEFEEATRVAIMSKLPKGFCPAWASQATWPIDKDGMTWVKIYMNDRSLAIQELQKQVDVLTQKLKYVKEFAAKIVAQ